jgi:hypothetical protein
MILLISFSNTPWVDKGGKIVLYESQSDQSRPIRKGYHAAGKAGRNSFLEPQTGWAFHPKRMAGGGLIGRLLQLFASA